MKNASALNWIIQNSYFTKKASLEDQRAQTEHRFLRRRLIGFMINVQFRVIGVHDSVLDCADFFAPILQNNYVQKFDASMDEILRSMNNFPTDDVMENLYMFYE